MKVIPRIGVSYSNENKLHETTKNVSSLRDPISVQSAKLQHQNEQKEIEPILWLGASRPEYKSKLSKTFARAQLSFWKNLRMKWIPAATVMKQTIQDEPERSNWAEKGSDCQSRQQN